MIARLIKSIFRINSPSKRINFPGKLKCDFQKGFKEGMDSVKEPHSPSRMMAEGIKSKK